MLYNVKMIKKSLFSVFFVMVLTTDVWGHAFPIRSDPKVGSEIAVSPELVRIWFDGPLESVFSEIKLFDSGGERIDQGKGKVVSNDPTLLTLPVQQLGPGKYRVRWEVVAKDGHRTEGDFTFQIR